MVKKNIKGGSALNTRINTALGLNSNNRASINNKPSANNRASINNKSSINNKPSANNAVKSANNSNKPKSNTMLIIGIVLLAIILVVAGVFIYRYYKNSKGKQSKEITKDMIPYIHDATIDKTFSGSSIPDSSQGNEYNINVWLYVNDYNYRKDEDKSIIYKGPRPEDSGFDADETNSTNKNCNPGIWFLKEVNTLRIITGLDTLYTEGCPDKTATVTEESALHQRHPVDHSDSCAVGTDEFDICDIHHFPLQKWVNLNISLINNVLDIFMNGKLKKSCILKGQPTLTKGELFVGRGGGFNGYVCNLKYSNKTLPLNKILSIYKNGPNLNGSSGSFLGNITSIF